MSAYVVFHFDATNGDVLEKHGQLVMESVQPYGAEFFLPPTVVEPIEGQPPRSMNVILRFPSAQDARNWYQSDTYQQGKKVRDGELNMLITLLA